MDPVLDYIFSTVLEGAWYVVGAYALLWVGLMVYVFFTMRRVGKLEQQVTILEDSIERRARDAAK